MSNAGDDIAVEAPAEVEVAAEAPKGKLSVEDALQVRFDNLSISVHRLIGMNSKF